MKDSQKIVIKRVCGCCKESLHINVDSIENAIYYDKTTYHRDCFINMCDRRSKMKRVDVSQKWSFVQKNIESIKKESYKHLYKEICKESVYDFIKESYGISIIPTTVWQKLASIYSGTFKGMTNGIPPDHLLDMWERKMDMLNKIAANNTTKGNSMKDDYRLNYDLSILVNKYDSYLRWRERQKILETEKAVEKSENIVGRSIGYSKQKNEDSYVSDDISDLVDDIFT